MVLKHFYKKYENQIIATGFVLILFIFIAFRYDFYYALNDDVVMKDILAGVYTGIPEGHNIQMQYPVSFFISILYRLFPEAPVYGFFLCFLQFACVYLVIERSLSFRRKTWSKLLGAGAECVLIITLFLKHFVFIHYTVTCGLLAATAAFLFITTKEKITSKEFIKKNIISVILVILGFGIRSEMLILVLPLICVAGIYKWSMEENIFAIENIRKYLSIFGGILAGIAVMFLINMVAYSGKEWKEFTRFFDSRTELYDFQGLPSYDENKELYDKLSIAEIEQEMLFEQYNFGLDDTIDAKILDAMSNYQRQINKETFSFKVILKRSFDNYRYRMIHKEPAGSATPDDYPWNLLVISGYLLVLAAGIWNGLKDRKKILKSAVQIGWKLALLGIIRSGLWMFIIARGRDPERITHPLYLVELCILFAMLFIENIKIKSSAIYIAVLTIIAVLVLPAEIIKVDKEYAGRINANMTDSAMKEYCRNHKENFYFIDVYSSVSDPITHIPYSEKVFSSDGNKISNYDIMGGWLVKSPLYDKKLKAFEIDSMQEALTDKEDVYLMVELEKGTELFIDYYKEQGLIVGIELIDTINEIIGVYKIEPNGE